MGVKAWRFPWYAIVVGVIPPLFVWSRDSVEIDPWNVLVHVGIGVSLAVGALALFARKLDAGRSGLAASLLVVGLTWPLTPIVAVLLPLLGIPLLYLSKPAPDKPGLQSMTLFLNGLSMTTAATSLVGILFYVTSGTPAKPAPKPIRLESKSRPDVWWIVLDGLSRADWLERRFGVGDVLGPGLAKRGFQVARASRANYPQTLDVLASTLNLDYVQSVAGRTEVSREEATAFLGANVVASSFRNAGYRTVFWPGGYHRVDPGLDSTHTTTFLPTEYHLWSMNRWPPVGIWRMVTGRSLSAIIRRRYTVRTLASVRGVTEGPPTFNFLHVVAPHAPFVIGANGEESVTGNADTIMDATSWNEENPGLSYRKGYAGQAIWVQPQILAAVDRILAPGARPAVVVVSSDHGSGLDLDWNRVSRDALADRLSTFWAVYVPGGVSKKVPQTISSVNTFRYVFDEAFGTSLGLLPDRSYWQNWDRPERLSDVTELVHGPK
jgi:hypothetical protein